MIYFTADEHYGHKNIIRFCKRPFKNTQEMNLTIIKNHNSVVKDTDTVYHLGDFSFLSSHATNEIITLLNGNHIFVQGSHDKPIKKLRPFINQIEEIVIEKQIIVLCHYAMRTWSKSHYGSWQLYGHSHGTLPPIGKQWDVGVDNNDFSPRSFNDIKNIMQERDDNPNLVKKNDRKY